MTGPRRQPWVRHVERAGRMRHVHHFMLQNVKEKDHFEVPSLHGMILTAISVFLCLIRSLYTYLRSLHAYAYVRTHMQSGAEARTHLQI